MHALHSIALVTPLLAPLGAQHPDWTVSGPTTFDAGAGVLELQDLTIEAGATLRFVGTEPVQLRVHGTLRIDGTLDASAADFANGIGVLTFNTTNIQERGLVGGPGGDQGGTGNRINFASSPIGGAGGGTGGGLGGESGYSGAASSNSRRGAGGGGGAFGPDLPLAHPDIQHVSNIGLAARDGLNGAFEAQSALDPTSVPRGGAHGLAAFTDADPSNDFFGRRRDPATGAIVVGELLAPRGGSGGGAGGNAVPSSQFPNPSWSPTADEKGSGGAGGGGLLVVRAQLVVIGPAGRILLDGGSGGMGENTSGLNGIGAGSGGGSGGMLVLHARRIDLSTASVACVRALGGDGGAGAFGIPEVLGGGGDGGPGVLQFHLANGLSDVILPAGRTLADLTVPPVHVLLPQPGY